MADLAMDAGADSTWVEPNDQRSYIKGDIFSISANTKARFLTDTLLTFNKSAVFRLNGASKDTIMVAAKSLAFSAGDTVVLGHEAVVTVDKSVRIEFLSYTVIDPLEIRRVTAGETMKLAKGSQIIGLEEFVIEFHRNSKVKVVDSMNVDYRVQKLFYENNDDKKFQAGSALIFMNNTILT